MKEKSLMQHNNMVKWAVDLPINTLQRLLDPVIHCLWERNNQTIISTGKTSN